MLQKNSFLIGISHLTVFLMTVFPFASDAQIFGRNTEPPKQEKSATASAPDEPSESPKSSAAPKAKAEKETPPKVTPKARPKVTPKARPKVTPKARPKVTPKARSKMTPKAKTPAKTAAPKALDAGDATSTSGAVIEAPVAVSPPSSGAEAAVSPPVDDEADCTGLKDCIAAIRSTLNEVSAASNDTAAAAAFERLDLLTRKAEAFLPAEGKDMPLSEAAASGTDMPPPPPSCTMSPEEQAEMNARLDHLEAHLSAVEEKSDANEKSIQAKQSSKGFKIFGPGETVFGIGALLQTRMETEQSGAPNGDAWSYGMYIRRLRFLFSGQLTKWLNFFVETEQANFGKDGKWDDRMFIQDAYVEFNLHPAVQIDVGMMLPSLSRHAMQSAGSLLGMDYHSTLIKYPVGSTMVWRDIGVKIRGLILRDRLDYRFAVWNGVHGSAEDPRNPKDYPRLSGRLTANIFEPEGGGGVGGMFFDGLYLKKDGKDVVSVKRVLSIGASFDWQPDLNVELATADAVDPTGYSDYVAAAGDIFWDIPFGNRNIFSANGQVDFYYYNHGNRRTEDGYWYYNKKVNTSNYTGWGMFGEFGIRYSKIQALFAMEVYESTKTDDDVGDYLNFSGGLNYYLAAHAATFKLYAGSDKAGDADWKTALKFQLQLSF
jgi:hypothetical protein